MQKWNLGKMIENVRDRIDEDTQDYISDSEIKDYLNLSFYDLAVALQLEEIYEVDLTKVKSTTLPADCLTVHSIFIDGIRKKIGTLADRNSGKDIYYIWNDKINFNNEQNGKLELFYFKAPKVLVDVSEEPDIPAQYNALSVLYCFARCKEKDEEFGLAQAIMQQYDDLKFQMISEMNTRKQASQVSFVDSSYYEDGGDY